ncbi:MAG: hypothetical protein CL875_06855 [Dehalococcoidales bacterium]|jgi:hypothetical protein|nr:hypothetical protein [Dehalococcoidales bacterium]|tara:strand:- start:688 stop:1365 length:678 start_codon:yes stop_codon:yes gene_type:complete
MKNSRLLLPVNKNYEYGYESAYKLAGEQLAKLKDIRQQCLNSGAQYLEVDSKKVITIEYLNQPYQVVLPDVEISLVDSQEEIPTRDRLLILHYFIRAKGVPITNKIITYQELPQGALYFHVFAKRVIKPLLTHFGQEPQRLITVAEKLGGHKVDCGDIAVTINAFRRVPVTIVLWRGDDEFAPEGSILFDDTISDYLPAEDVVVLCETISWKLVTFLKEAQDGLS